MFTTLLKILQLSYQALRFFQKLCISKQLDLLYDYWVENNRFYLWFSSTKAKIIQDKVRESIPIHISNRNFFHNLPRKVVQNVDISAVKHTLTIK